MRIKVAMIRPYSSRKTCSSVALASGMFGSVTYLETDGKFLMARLTMRFCGSLNQRANLYRAGSRYGNLLRDRDRVSHVINVDQKIAAELLVRFGKRSVGHQLFPVTNPDAAAHGRKLQLRAVEIFSG